TVTLVNGSASFSTAALAAGSHPLTAAYNGSAAFAASTSAVVTQLVNAPAAAATTTNLTSTPNPSTTGQAVTLSATVTSAAGVPTGTVTFRDGATVLGTVTLVNGSASISIEISSLSVETHSELPAGSLGDGTSTIRVAPSGFSLRACPRQAGNSLKTATANSRATGPNAF